MKIPSNKQITISLRSGVRFSVVSSIELAVKLVKYYYFIIKLKYFVISLYYMDLNKLNNTCTNITLTK